MNGVQQQELNEQLLNAINVGEVEEVKRLIEERGVDPNIQNSSGHTALHLAALSGHLNIVQYLIEEKGVDPNIQNSSGMTPLYFTLLRVALDTSQLGIVKFLVEVGADVKAGIRLTPLHLAVLGSMLIDNTEILEALIQAGADTEMADEDVMTPLHVAVEKGSIECSKTLIKYTVLLNYGATKPDYITNHTGLSQFWDNCKSQVEGMLGKSNISVRRFLRETDGNKLAAYLSSKSTGVREELEKAQHVTNFSVYADMIKKQFNKGKERKYLLDQANMAMNSNNLAKLPEEIRREVTDYLTNADLGNLGRSAVGEPGAKLNSPNAERTQVVGQSPN